MSKVQTARNCASPTTASQQPTDKPQAGITHVVRALLDDLSLVQNDDAVRVADLSSRGEANCETVVSNRS
jgi:hypothetical protein